MFFSLICHLLLESLFFISCAKVMSKCAQCAFPHWLIILQTHSAAKTLVAHRGLVKGWDLSSLLVVRTEASSPLSPSSSCIVSTQVTVVKSFIKKNTCNHNQFEDILIKKHKWLQIQTRITIDTSFNNVKWSYLLNKDNSGI